MKSPMASLLLLMTAGGICVPATAQNVLGRLESDIRQANGQPAAIAAPAPKVYLGAIALDEAGGGVRITSIRGGGPAQKAGLQAQDLVVGAAGKPIQLLRELTALLSGMNPGDKVPLEVVRGTRRMRIEVALGAPPAAPGAGVPALAGVGRTEAIPPPPSGPRTGVPALAGAGRTEAIPPPPGELPLPSPADGPALNVPAPPVAPPQPIELNSPQSQIEELRHRVDQLEHRVQELEKALAEARKK